MGKKLGEHRSGTGKRSRHYGDWYQLDSGVMVYYALRFQDEMFRSGMPTLSDAIRAGKACWAIDEKTLLEVRSKGIDYIGVLIKDSLNFWLTQTARFRDIKLAKTMNFSDRGGSVQRFLPLDQFKFEAGVITL